MAELLCKNMLVCSAFEDPYVKKEVYKPNCLQVKSSEKVFVLCNWIWGNELSLLSFINDRNGAVTKQSFLPNFQACTAGHSTKIKSDPPEYAKNMKYLHSFFLTVE